MNEFIVQRNELLARTTIEGLAKRNMVGYYAKDKDEALKIALSLIPEGSKVTHGGAISAIEIGLIDAIKKGNYDYLDRNAAADKRAAELWAYDADIYIGGVNGLSKDGILVNIDGHSNRVSAYAYGPKKLVLIVGMNKITNDFDSAMKRARGTAAPINAQRFGLDTPCSKTGACFDCLCSDSICCQFLVTRYNRHTDRVHIILVNDELGF